MKHPFKKGLVAASALALVGAFVACGDDNPSNPGPGNTPDPVSSSSIDQVLPGVSSSSADVVQGSSAVVPGSSATVSPR